MMRRVPLVFKAVAVGDIFQIPVTEPCRIVDINVLSNVQQAAVVAVKHADFVGADEEGKKVTIGALVVAGTAVKGVDGTALTAKQKKEMIFLPGKPITIDITAAALATYGIELLLDPFLINMNHD
jgi:hypothetical protein